MKNQLKKFAPYGLYLSIAALIAAIGLFIVQKSFTLPIQISLGVIVLGLALAILFDPQKARETLSGRQAKYASNSILMVLAFLGILIVINYLVNNYSKRWDLTESQEHTLAPESINVLKSLSQPVSAQAFYTQRTSSTAARTLLDNFKNSGNGKFTYEFIDPDANFAAAKAANVTRDGTIVLKMGNSQEPVTYTTEQEITSALIRLSNPGKRVVYFLTGHGEMETSAYTQAKASLTSKNYTVTDLNLISDHKIPDDALALIIAGPKKPLSQEEADTIKTFLDNGKSVLYFLEPSPLTEFGTNSDPFGEYLVKTWGIHFDDDVIIDPSINPPVVAAAASYGNHAITQKMQNMATIFPTARSIQTGQVDGVTSTALVLTSSSAWGETDIAALNQNQIKFDESKDIAGPDTIAYAAENSKTKARVVVIGDADFAGDQYNTQYGNGDFFVNSVDWAAQQENLISLTPKNSTSRIMVPPQNFVMGLILLGTIFVIPGLVVLSGVVVWVQRKRKG